MATSNQACYLVSSEGDFVVKEAPYTKPGPGEVVIKNAAIAINPMDWKIKDFGSRLPFPKAYPAIIGADVAGEIYETGEGVTAFRKGDRVMGLANWFRTARNQDGGFQHFITCATNLIARLPDSIPFTSGVVLPLGLATSAMGLYPSYRLALPLPQPTKPASINKIILIWGGSSSMGSSAVQLAVASGATVVTTASPRNHDFVKSLGASAVLDYKDEKIVEKLVETIKETAGEFVGALDAIAEEDVIVACAEVVKSLGGGKVATNLPQSIEKTMPEGVELLPVNDTATIGSNAEIIEGVWAIFVPKALEVGTLKAVPEPVVIGKGLEKVSQGVDLCRAGVSATKIVIEL